MPATTSGALQTRLPVPSGKTALRPVRPPERVRRRAFAARPSRASAGTFESADGGPAQSATRSGESRMDSPVAPPPWLPLPGARRPRVRSEVTCAGGRGGRRGRYSQGGLRGSGCDPGSENRSAELHKLCPARARGGRPGGRSSETPNLAQGSMLRGALHPATGRPPGLARRAVLETASGRTPGRRVLQRGAPEGSSAMALAGRASRSASHDGRGPSDSRGMFPGRSPRGPATAS